MKVISIVIPVMNESENLRPIYEVVKEIMETHEWNFELIFVCDPSTDGTEKLISEICQSDNRIHGLFMAERAGQTECIRAGYEASCGDAVITMDADFQDPPKLLPDMIRSWLRGNLIVHMQRVDRTSDRLSYRITTTMGYRALAWLTNGRVKRNVGDFRLVDKSILPLLLKFQDPNPFWRGIASMSGVQSEILTHARPPRTFGESKYGPRIGSPTNALRGMVSFSYKPLEFLQTLGIVSLAISFIASLVTIVAYFALPGFPRGVPTIITLLSIYFGIQFFSTAIIATYLMVLVDQTRRRPNYLLLPNELARDLDEK